MGVLAEQVGPCGTIIGVYLTVEMLDKARERVHRHAWTNVALVEYDAAEYRLSHGVDDIRSTYVITLVPEYDLVIQEGAAASLPPKRLVILDFKKPEHWPNWLIRLFAAITRPFGVSLDLAQRLAREAVARYLTVVQFQGLYSGAMYLCVGEAG